MRRNFKGKIKTATIIAVLICSTIFMTEEVYSNPISEQIQKEFGDKALYEMTPNGSFNPGEVSDIYFHEWESGQPTGGTTETAPSEGTTNSTPEQTTKPTEKPTTCDHNYKSVITKKPTHTEEGELVKTCTKCGDKITETIPSQYQIWVLYATIGIAAAIVIAVIAAIWPFQTAPISLRDFDE